MGLRFVVVFALIAHAAAVDWPFEEIERFQDMNSDIPRKYHEVMNMKSNKDAIADMICPTLLGVDEIMVSVFLLILAFQSLTESRVIALGDSNLERWGNDTYCGDHCSTNIDSLQNYGMPGITCNQLATLLSSSVETKDTTDLFGSAEWIVLQCGQVDLAFGFCSSATSYVNTANAVFARFKTLIDSLHAAAPELKVLYPGGAYGASPDPTKVESLESKIADYAKTLAGNPGVDEPYLVYIDVMSVFDGMSNGEDMYALDENSNLSLFTADGYEHWTEWIETALDATGTDADCVIWKNGDCETHLKDIPKASGAHLTVGMAVILSLLASVFRF